MEKRIWIADLILAVVIILMMLLPIKANADEVNVYPTCGVVTEINTAEDYVVFTDPQGFEWSFYGVEDWMVGDIIAVIMSDKGTEEIFDDEVIMAKYCG